MSNNLTRRGRTATRRGKPSQNLSFQEYVQELKESFDSWVEYQQRTGTTSEEVLRVRDELFDQDPFVVIEAAVEATMLMHEKLVYH